MTSRNPISLRELRPNLNIGVFSIGEKEGGRRLRAEGVESRKNVLDLLFFSNNLTVQDPFKSYFFF